jgi:hypothetical protein
MNELTEMRGRLYQAHAEAVECAWQIDLYSERSIGKTAKTF